LITGFNTDIKHNDKVYHIQTEDKGLQNPYIESLVYVGGEILASRKTSYADKIVERGFDEKAISALMEQQHKTMIAAIKRGRLDHLSETQTKPKAVGTVVHPQPAEATPAGEEKSLDQVILDYLTSEAEAEHLELSLLSPVEFVSGQPVEMRVSTRRSLSHEPIGGAAIEVRIISTIEPPRTIYKGKTGEDGSATIRCLVPPVREGSAAVIVSAQSELGNDEVKQLVKRKR
jgi:hypothetical protein